MTIRDTAFEPGRPCWVDLFTSDVEESKTFYGELLGWQFVDGGPEYGGYLTATSDGYRVAGVMANDGAGGAPDLWTTYLATQDIHATAATAIEAGATTIVPPMAVSEMGSMAVLVDPAGAAFGLWQAASHTGFGKFQDDNAVVWDEHHSKDFPASREFYASVFGWTYETLSDTDDFRYSIAEIDGTGVAGLMDSASFLPPEVPSHWAVYFAVPDVDAAASRAVALGGTVLHSARDTPWGRMCDLLDSTGAALKLMRPAPNG